MEFSWSPPRQSICSSVNLSRQRPISFSESCKRFTAADRNSSPTGFAMSPTIRSLLMGKGLVPNSSRRLGWGSSTRLRVWVLCHDNGTAGPTGSGC